MVDEYIEEVWIEDIQDWGKRIVLTLPQAETMGHKIDFQIGRAKLIQEIRKGDCR